MIWLVETSLARTSVQKRCIICQYSMVMTLKKALEVEFLDEEFSRLTKPQAQNALRTKSRYSCGIEMSSRILQVGCIKQRKHHTNGMLPMETLMSRIFCCCVEKGHIDFRECNSCDTPGHSDLELKVEVGGPRCLYWFISVWKTGYVSMRFRSYLFRNDLK